MARVRGYLEEGRNVLIFLLHTGKSGLPNRYLFSTGAWIEGGG